MTWPFSVLFALNSLLGKRSHMLSILFFILIGNQCIAQEVLDIYFFEKQGRPFHELYFPSPANPSQSVAVIGATVTDDPLEVSISLYDDADELISTTVLTRVNLEEDMFIAEINVPIGKFFARVSGVDSQSTAFTGTAVKQFGRQSVSILLQLVDGELAPSSTSKFEIIVTNQSTSDQFRVSIGDDDLGLLFKPFSRLITIAEGESKVLEFEFDPMGLVLEGYFLNVTARIQSTTTVQVFNFTQRRFQFLEPIHATPLAGPGTDDMSFCFPIKLKSEKVTVVCL